MACFPRKLRIFNRAKASFTPAEDENKDTLLNNAANPVQIGRYIRREETAFFTPKSSEGQIIDNRSNDNNKNTGSNNGNGNNVTKSNNANGSLVNNGSGNVNSLPPKKFISNKAHNLSRNNSANKSNNNSNKFNASNSLLKPVKGRRPTALPSDAPNLEEEEQRDDVDGVVEGRAPTELDKIVEAQTGALHVDIKQANGYRSNSSDKDTPTTPGSTLAVRFFIGQHAHEEDAVSAESLDAGSYRSIKAVTTQGSEHQQQHQQKQTKKLLLHTAHVSDSTNNASTFSSLLQLPALGSHEWTPQHSSNRFTNATSSPSLYGPQATTRKSKSKSWRKARGSSPPAEDLHIPPPPPLPPLPLTSASSSASLLSLRSNKIKHSSSSAVATFTAASSHIEEGGISANAEFATPAGYDVRYAGTGSAEATTAASDATNDKFSLERQFYTLSEILNLSDNSTITINSELGRDSGVLVEEQTSTPKESDNSDTPQVHRVEGGLIFTRPNLPAKKDVHIEFIEKDNETRNLIRKAIERNDFLNNYMDKERKEMVIDAMAPTFYKKDSYIIHENDEGSEIYVSETGYFDVIKGGKVVGSFGPTTVFGELAILYNANRLASVRATTNARVWKITRETFRQIMVLSESKERDENLTFLRAAPFLNDLSDAVLNKVVDLLQRKYYEPNACIVREGEVGNEFFIIRGGTVTIKKKNEQNVERVVDRRKRGDYFGEQALLNADRRQASVYADAPGTEVLKLDREAFISYLGTIPQLREKPEERKSAERKQSTRQSEFDNEYAHIQLTDLKKVATLGAGAFGCVDLVTYNDKTFALKIIKKIDVIKQDQVEHVYSEKHVMMKCRSSPFIIELYKTFRNEKFVYFLMEACMGGDVWTVMSQRRFFDERTAKFIAGCVVEAFDFLHAHNIIYRDLKPENLMLTTDGYCKLVDFGFAKHIPPNQKTNTFAGTPEYVAPEIILDRGHDRAVDYWALGILIFELLVGKTPFRGQNQIKIYQQILGGIDVIQMPSKIPRSAQGLIKHLCKQLPAERLGYQRRGILDIKRHSWFDNLDWNKLKYKQLPSPIKRPITCNTDLQYFGPAGVENDYDPPDETSGWDIDF
ncbi:PREDICTED: cGMP-dependent protein kinase 1 isoform X2 [Bactrocera latifrons]|uniref:cGMP-dependent protein kinase 1 isoform X2 n=1 Tax=Bactrocera latifrons TaxID=174628 RepID=UPI0008DDDA3B|nr:PREDICTED: cGMP-dependent protein kinase 1 isoform X2 [Bactrocera latifrons]